MCVCVHACACACVCMCVPTVPEYIVCSENTIIPGIIAASFGIFSLLSGQLLSF